LTGHAPHPKIEAELFEYKGFRVPLYEYQCKKCRHIFEKIQQFSDQPVKKCPECGGPVEQLLSAPAVQFKGSGWYVTDYARKSGSDKGRTSESASSTSSDKDGTKSPEKSETKKKESKGESSSKK
jgi:putative FmdB family regulatory protein